jgi:hypothetical protein
MSFPWLERTPARRDGSAQRAKVAATELADRAALFFRLGFSVEDATKRLTERVAWEFDPAAKSGHHNRPDGLSDQAVAKIVKDTYARRPK